FFNIKIYRMDSNSMEPVINKGDVVIAWKQKRYKRGDRICLFMHPVSIMSIRTIAATAGDVLEVEENTLMIGDKKYNINTSTYSFLRSISICGAMTTPMGKIFAVSENPNGYDSKELGFFEEKDVEGVVLFWF
ncbi:signal peptidase I, partial [Termitidicoccus mucosus]